MIPLLNAAALVLAHAGEAPHVHPHETGVALGLVVALIAGSVLAMLKGRESQTGAPTGAFSTSTSTVIPSRTLSVTIQKS